MTDGEGLSADAREHRARGDALYRSREDVRGALAAYEDAIRCGTDPLALAYSRWMCAALLGDFETAWRISDDVLAERRRRGLSCHDRPLRERWVWEGATLAGRRILVRCYHGLGDTIQFIRFTASLRTIARGVTVQAPPPLLPLLASVAGVDRVVPLGGPAPDPPFDVDIEIMELAHALRMSPETLPADVPYIAFDPRRAAARRRELGGDGAVLVGVVWAVGAGWQPERSLPPHLLKPLADVPGVVLVNLQRGDAALAELDRAPADAPRMVEWGGRTTDLVETAATLCALDLVVTIDTMIAHLAGALGVPVWTLLPFHADWRWMVGRRDSPWYPSMRLYRQPEPGAWRDVVDEAAAALRDLVRHLAIAGAPSAAPSTALLKRSQLAAIRSSASRP